MVKKLNALNGRMANASAMKRQVLLDAVSVGRIDSGGTAQGAAALGVFGLHQVPPAGARAQYFSARRDLEALGYRFPGLDAFWTSHNWMNLSVLSKKSAQYRQPRPLKQAVF
jgi:hypothetical protein